MHVTVKVGIHSSFLFYRRIYAHVFDDYSKGVSLKLGDDATRIWEDINDKNTDALNASWHKMEPVNPILTERDRIILRLAAVVEVFTITFITV